MGGAEVVALTSRTVVSAAVRKAKAEADAAYRRWRRREDAAERWVGEEREEEEAERA